MLKRIATSLWGNFESVDEIKKFGLLALIFGLIIGTYWGLRPIKDSIFNAVVGGDWLPYAKMFSLVIIVPLIVLYGKLVDTFPRHKVFYLLISIYAVVAILFTLGFMHPTIGLTNTVKSPYRMIGWAWYVFVESFGSLIVALFWAFTTDITKPDSAIRGFPIIAMFGQIGNILGPLILNAKKLGFSNSAPIVGIIAGLMVCIGLSLRVFMYIVPKSQLVGYQAKDEEEKESEPGFFEGLKLLISQGYLLGIFLIISFFEIIVTVFDNHFKQSVFETYGSEAEVQAYLSNYAVWVGIIATLCILLGINRIQKFLGIRASLLLLPILVTIAVVSLKFYPTALTVAFWIMVISKAVNYALNQPTLKQLYIPTTKDTKYKAQAWMEMFGSRGSKAVSSVGNTFRASFKKQYGMTSGITWFLTLSSIISLGLVGVWIFVAFYVARTYNKAVEEKRVVC